MVEISKLSLSGSVTVLKLVNLHRDIMQWLWKASGSRCSIYQMQPVSTNTSEIKLKDQWSLWLNFLRLFGRLRVVSSQSLLAPMWMSPRSLERLCLEACDSTVLSFRSSAWARSRWEDNCFFKSSRTFVVKVCKELFSFWIDSSRNSETARSPGNCEHFFQKSLIYSRSLHLRNDLIMFLFWYEHIFVVFFFRYQS